MQLFFKYFFTLWLRVAKPSQVYFGGDIRGESAMKSEEEVGSLIQHEFRVHFAILFITNCMFFH